MVEATQAGDYATCLSLHAQVLMNKPFTEIASFIFGMNVFFKFPRNWDSSTIEKKSIQLNIESLIR